MGTGNENVKIDFRAHLRESGSIHGPRYTKGLSN